jgi:hypothetical protein
MNWRNHISDHFPDAKFCDPPSPEVLRSIETQLQVELPRDLADLYSETDGFLGYIGSDIVWKAADLLEHNLEMRSGYEELYMPFDCLLFFGEDGGGDFFGFRILSTGVETWQTFRWEHETDSRVLYSTGLADHIKKFGDTFYAEKK